MSSTSDHNSNRVSAGTGLQFTPRLSSQVHSLASTMRLLKTRTGEFEWTENPEQLCYAILSHVWSTDGSGEQTYADLCRIQEQVRDARAKDPSIPADEVLRRASPKIRNACAFALAEGIEHIWIIDKTSSAELGEAINSMYDWYRLSTVCYAFLHDVDGHEDPYLDGASSRRSRSHERGWTLQELMTEQSAAAQLEDLPIHPPHSHRARHPSILQHSAQ
ncbi:hypothetical protein C8Q74DRAFT_1251234 [Fomes fomentarius]|nr:hypothetical protein C8Q74DRAFT_1251234 [Fomes fomentarius]